jgi:predicted MPP superfamily phosphohydrolase
MDLYLVYRIVVWTLAATAGGAGAAVLIRGLRRAPNPLNGWSACRGLLPALAVTAAACLPLAAAGLAKGLFGCVHAAYAGLTLTLPLFGLAILWGVMRRATPCVRWLLAGPTILALLPAPAGIYASVIEPTWLEIVEVDVPVAGLPEGSRPIRIVVLADLQFRTVTGYERRVVQAALAQTPDIILLPGDFVQASNTHFAAHGDSYLELLRPLSDHPCVLAVLGNIDPPDRTVSLLNAAGLQVLNDKIVAIRVGDARIAIGGIDYWRPPPSPVYSALAATPADIRIVMSHVPDEVFHARPEHQIDLIIAGHTHGGQVVIPGFGPPLTLSGVPRAVAAGGLHTVAGQRVYVSRGIGMERGSAPPVRLFCRPELTILTLHPAARAAAAP